MRRALNPAEAGLDRGITTHQADGQVVVVPDAHLLFTAEFSRIGADLLLTGQDGTTSDRGPLRARRVADAAVAARDDDPARAGRRFRRLDARSDQSFLSGKTSQKCEVRHRREFSYLLRTTQVNQGSTRLRMW